MGINKKKLSFSLEAIYNNFGQIYFKYSFLDKSIMRFYRYILRGS